MVRLPPRWVRRALLAPLVPLATLVLVTSVPVLAVVAAAVSPRLPGRWRPLRLLWFGLVVLVVESLGILATFVLWVASGFGWKVRSPRFQAAHYTLMRGYTRTIVATARRTFNLSLELDGASRQTSRAGQAPLVVLARHAGPGDSFLLVSELFEFGYRPRVVLKDTLQWAPLLDIVLNRVPARFVGPAGAAGGPAPIARLAAGMGPRDALVLFPEGGNFTEGRRLRSIAKLEELGKHAEAEQARSMRHVLAPRPGGALAAMRGAPDAHVALIAHTGLEDLSGVVDLWRGLPMDEHVDVRAWLVSPDELPTSDEERAVWLFDWWRAIDTWIMQRRGRTGVTDDIARELTAGGDSPDVVAR